MDKTKSNIDIPEYYTKIRTIVRDGTLAIPLHCYADPAKAGYKHTFPQNPLLEHPAKEAGGTDCHL